MKTFQQWAEFLGKKESRPVANNTRVHRAECDIAIRLHNTDVVTFCPDGRVVLNSGGWKTNTTKDRINSYSPVGISQCKGVWTFSHGGKEHIFQDGVIIHPDGSVTGAAPVAQVDADKAKRKEIAKFAALCASKLPLPMPGAGDCWYCCMKTEGGQSLGQALKDTSHLNSHMKEGYVVPSLVWQSLEFAGYQPGRHIAHGLAFGKQEAGNMDGFARNAVKRSVRKYLLRQYKLA